MSLHIRIDAAVLACIAMLGSPPVSAQEAIEPTDAVSPEVSVYNATNLISITPEDAISPEVSLYNLANLLQVTPDDAVSPEVSVFNLANLLQVAPSDAISPEISVYNMANLLVVEPTDAISPEISVRVDLDATATALVFNTQPGTSPDGYPLAPQPVVRVVNAEGYVVSQFSGSISLSIKNGTGTPGALLLGTTTMACSAGSATFQNVSVNTPGNGYVLVASSPGLASAESAPFNVTGQTEGLLRYELIADPPEVLANETETSTLVARCTDARNVVLEGQRIRFISHRGAADKFSSLTDYTDEHGLASVTIKSAEAGVSTITILDETLGITPPVSTQVTFIDPQPPDENEGPILGEITTSLNSKGPFFEGVMCANEVSATVLSWNGSPGRVEFVLNGRTRYGALSGTTAAVTLDMGKDLEYSLTGEWNELEITAYNSEEEASNTRTVMLLGYALPDFLAPGNWSKEVGENPTLTFRPDGSVEVAFVVAAPDSNPSARVQSHFPLMGNTVWGTKTSGLSLRVTFDLKPVLYPDPIIDGTATIEGAWYLTKGHDTRIGRRPTKRYSLSSVEWEGGLTAAGTLDLNPLSLDKLSVGAIAGLTAETPNLLPMVPYLNTLSWLLDLYGTFGANAEGNVNFADVPGHGLQILDMPLRVEFTASLVFGLNRNFEDLVTANIKAGADPYAWMEFPGTPENASYFFGVPFIHQVGVDFYVTGTR